MARLNMLAVFILVVGGLHAAETANWPGFRGPDAQGVAHGVRTPLDWDATAETDSSILWRTKVPGLGHSSPTVWGDRLFLATAVSDDGDAPLQVGRSGGTAAADDDGVQSWQVLCYDKTSGEELWRRTARQGEPRATRHAKATHANTTVAVDKNHVVAFFGSEGLYCYDHDGQLLWQRDLGVINVSKYGIGWGYASSPVIRGDRIVLVCDAPDDPYVIAVNIFDGEELWRTSRKGDCERSWGTALIHQTADATQVVVNGWPWIISYNLETGEERWRIEGGGDNPVPTPFAIDERIYITNAHGAHRPIVVVRSDATGNLSEDNREAEKSLVWRSDRGGCYMSTPIVYGDYLYLGNTNGVVRCFHAVTGEEIYEERLGSGASVVASLVAADDKIYCPSEDGTIYVLKPGPEFEILAKNRMGEPCFATPAISAGTLFVRTTETLYAIRPSDHKELASHGEDQRRPNILFIAVDDLRPSLGCYGDPCAVTPNIDRLADSGLQFNRAYCQVAVCNPSRASLMTGLRPDNLGVWTLPIHFREAKPDAITLPQWFRKFGYTAVSHGKIYHNPTPDPQSWSEPIRPLPDLPYPYPEGTRELVRKVMEGLPANDWRKNNLRGPSTAAPDLDDSALLDGARTDMAIEDLRRLGQQPEPFFLAMGYIRPHLAWISPKKYWEMHDPEKLPVMKDQRVIPNTPPYAPHNNSELSHYVDLIDIPRPWDDGTLPEETMRRLVHAYYACVSYVDAQIGRLLDALQEEGLDDNTIVVLWSDHGWKLGENRGWGKMTNYELDARVPLIIAAPGMRTAGRTTDELAELLDLYPTLCDLAEITVPDFVDGRSLVPLLKDTNAKVHDNVMSQYYRSYEGHEYMGYSMRTDEYRFVEWRDFHTGSVTARELYDHRSGDAEKENVADSVPPAVVDELTQQIVASHPRSGLVMTPAVHSNPNGGRWPAKLTFANKTQTELLAYPITPRGRRGRVRRMGPNESVAFSARIGGVYVVESVDGTIHEIHSPSYPPRPIVIR